MGEATAFWDTVRSNWTGLQDDQLRPLSQAVLMQFRRRLPASENQHLFSELPPEIESLSATESDREAEQHERPADTVEATDFYQRISDQTGASLDEARQACNAVFMALASQLSKEEVDNVRHMLPPDLETQWHEAFQRTRPH